MQVESPTSLVVTLAAQNGNFGLAVTNSSLNWVASPEALENASAAEYDDNPVGAGPFLLDEWTRQSQLVVKRNPDYFDAPKPYLDEIRFSAIADAEQRLQALQAGDADMVWNSNPSVTARVDSDDLYVTTVKQDGGLGMQFNMTEPPFDDPKARMAIVQALDRKTINDAVYNGDGNAPRICSVQNLRTTRRI